MKIFFLLMIIGALVAGFFNLLFSAADERSVIQYRQLKGLWNYRMAEQCWEFNGRLDQFHPPSKCLVPTYPTNHWPYAYENVLFTADGLVVSYNDFHSMAFTFWLLWIGTNIVGLVGTWKKGKA